MHDGIALSSVVLVSAQIARVIRGRIGGGSFCVGDRFPDEKTLARQFRVSRNTVREALKEPAAEGLAVCRRAWGVLVALLPGGEVARAHHLCVPRNPLDGRTGGGAAPGEDREARNDPVSGDTGYTCLRYSRYDGAAKARGGRKEVRCCACW